MRFKDLPIQKKLMRVILLISGILLLLTSATYFVYEYYTFHQTTKQKLSTIGQVIAANSTSSLAFDNSQDAEEILSALKAEPHIIAACLYNEKGKLFSQYNANLAGSKLSMKNTFPDKPGPDGYRYTDAHLEGFEPIVQGDKRLGTLYLRSDLKEMNSRFGLYGLITVIVLGISFLLAFSLSRRFQRSISQPILDLALITQVISNHHDYSVRARKAGNDEIGVLTDAFNQMVEQIEDQNQQLNRFNQNLEQMVADRTAELQTVNKEMEAFSYSISHDLRAPIRAIHGYMNIFSEEYGTKVDDEGKRLMQMILNNSKKMGHLIDDLLAFSKLGRKELIKVNVSMREMVQGVWNELIKTEENRMIALDLKSMPDAWAEGTTIQQVWINLISNALKYTRNNPDTLIEISGEERSQDIVYSVKDNGSGFDMEYYGKLFGVFQRLHSQEEFEGTGVGLAIVQRIIEKHGGKIWAEGKVNVGATFYFSLPKANH
jgi:signal transduction histidine kinase